MPCTRLGVRAGGDISRADSLGPQKNSERFGLSVAEGYDLEEVKHSWSALLGYLVRSAVPIVHVSIDEPKREIIIDWRGALLETIGQYMAQLKHSPEYGGRMCVFDLHEDERRAASQHVLGSLEGVKLRVQRKEEAPEQLKKLQPEVCSLGGIFGAAELGNNYVMDALLKGYPMPQYDPKAGRCVPNPDRLAVSENKHTIRAPQQFAHRPTCLQYSHANCNPAGDPLDDLRLSAPHLWAQKQDSSAVMQGASFDLRDEYGKTPLHFAAASGRTETVRLLLNNGADPNVLDREGHAPMHLAALQGHSESLALLLERGGRVGLAGVSGRTVLHCACQNGNAELVRALLLSHELRAHKAFELMERRTFGENETVLHALCKSPFGTTEEINSAAATTRHLLKAWLQMCNRLPPELLDVQDVNGSTALHVCAHMGNVELLRYICSFGAKPNVQCRNGDTPMHIAARAGSTAMATVLLSSGANVSLQNGEGQTPLHIAATVGVLPVFKMCIHSFPQSTGCTPFGVLDESGDSAIHIAARNCRPPAGDAETPFRELVRYAVNNRADPCMRNSQGDTPLLCASMGGDDKTVAFLIKFTYQESGESLALPERNFSGESAVSHAARHGHVDAIVQLAKLGAELDVRSRTGVGCVSEAAEAGHAGGVRALLQMGADLNAVDVLGRVALHWAAKKGHAEVVRVLVEEFEQPPDPPDRVGDTPLHLASRAGMLDAVSALLEGGAEPEARNRHDETPMHVAEGEEVLHALQRRKHECGGFPSRSMALARRSAAATVEALVAGVGDVVREQARREEEERLAAEAEKEALAQAAAEAAIAAAQATKPASLKASRKRSSQRSSRSRRPGTSSSAGRRGSPGDASSGGASGPPSVHTPATSDGAPSQRSPPRGSSPQAGSPDGDAGEDFQILRVSSGTPLFPNTHQRGEELHSRTPKTGRASILSTPKSRGSAKSVRWGKQRPEVLFERPSSTEKRTKRPFTAYSNVTDGEPQTREWMLPARPDTVGGEGYQKLSPRDRPKHPEVFHGTGSALDLQMLKVEWAANSPYAKMFGRASTASTATEAWEEIQAKFGSYKSTDPAWASLDRSSYWLNEHKLQRVERLQREHAPMLRAMQRAVTAPADAPRKIVGEGKDPPEAESWLPALHGTSPFKRPSTEDPNLVSVSTSWWYDQLQSNPALDGEWVKNTERTRPNDSEAARLVFQKERWRAEELARLIQLDELEEQEDEHAASPAGHRSQGRRGSGFSGGTDVHLPPINSVK